MDGGSRTSEHWYERMKGKEKAAADKVSRNVPTGLGERTSNLDR